MIGLKRLESKWKVAMIEIKLELNRLELKGIEKNSLNLKGFQNK